MENLEPKQCLLEFFLDFVQRYKPLSQVRIATLGGRGYEAEIWKNRGIKHMNAWLIERSKRLGKQLIKNTPFRYYASLGTFPRLVEEVYGRQTGIDAIHIDLCGTLEAAANAVAPVIPLLMKGEARCLAITVADQRRNPTLDNFANVQKHLQKILNRAGYEQLFDSILDNQQQLPSPETRSLFTKPFDPYKGAQRELGVLSCILKFVSNRETSIVPDTVTRYAYVSRMTGSPFRMRSYFFHFEPVVQKASTALALIEQWCKQPIIWIPGTVEKLNKGDEDMDDMTNRFPTLQAIVAAVKGDAEREFKELVKLAERSKLNRKLTDLVEKIRDNVNEYMQSVPFEKYSGCSDSADTLISQLNGASEKDKQLLQLFEARTKGEQVYQETAMLIAAADGFNIGTKNWRGFVSRSSGRFLPTLLHRVYRGIEESELAERFLEHYTIIYNKDTGEKLSVAQFKVLIEKSV